MFTSLRKIPRNIWALSLTSFFRDVASEMLVHLLPLFLANVLGIRTAVIGLIEGVAETTASFTISIGSAPGKARQTSSVKRQNVAKQALFDV